MTLCTNFAGVKTRRFLIGGFCLCVGLEAIFTHDLLVWYLLAALQQSRERRSLRLGERNHLSDAHLCPAALSPGPSAHCFTRTTPRSAFQIRSILRSPLVKVRLQPPPWFLSDENTLPLPRRWQLEALAFLCKCISQTRSKLHYLDWAVPLDTSLEVILSGLRFEPDYLLHPDSGFPFLPDGIARSIVPTIRLDVDTYAFTRRRIRWASLFDHVAVCHPGYRELFQRELQHDSTLLLAHAVHREYFDLPEIDREFDFGWAGQIAGPIYKKRAAWLPPLASKFRTNDWSQSHNIEGVAGIYRRSRIVVNISRDDYPQDANLRVFEALASGALLPHTPPERTNVIGFCPWCALRGV